MEFLKLNNVEVFASTLSRFLQKLNGDNHVKVATPKNAKPLATIPKPKPIQSKISTGFQKFNSREEIDLDDLV